MLEVVNNDFLYAQVQLNSLTHQATFYGGTKFNAFEYQTIPSDEDCWDIQLILHFDKDHFPFFVALNCLLSTVFLVHTATRQRIALISVKKLHRNDKIHEVY